jgi:hypothetical protein
MRFLRRFFIRLSNFTAGRRADQRLQEEMAEHLALQTEENLRAGLPPAEARRQATLKPTASSRGLVPKKVDIAGRNSGFTLNRQCTHRVWNAEHLAE